MILTALSAVFLATVAVPVTTTAQGANPVVQAAHRVASQGLSAKPKPATSPTKFRARTLTPIVDQVIQELMDSSEERKVLRGIVEQLATNYEETLRPAGLDSDAAGAMAFALVLLAGEVTGKEPKDEAIIELAHHLQATLDRPEVRGASDTQKRELYDLSLTALSMALLTKESAQTDDQRKAARDVAGSMLRLLCSLTPDQLSIEGGMVRVKAKPAAPVARREETAEAPVTAGGLAPGFTYSVPAGWQKKGDWFISSENQGMGASANTLIRMGPAIPAQGSMSDALRKQWDTLLPAEAKGKASGMVFRRYVGDRLLAQFIVGLAREQGRIADTHFTLMLVDCKTHWQPVVIALTYEDTFAPGADFTAGYQRPSSALRAEPFFASFRGPVKHDVLVDKEALVGNYSFGSGGSQWWQNVATGATSMTFATSGGGLNLKGDGTFSYRFTSASGAVGAMNVGRVTGSGRWSVEGDLLVLRFTEQESSGSKSMVQSYRIAGVTQFADGKKIAILLFHKDRPVNGFTVSDSADWFRTGQ